MGFIGLLLQEKKTAAGAAAELDLDAEEIALLVGSTPSTKKVQSIFEEAQKRKAEAQAAEIDLAWRGRATSVKAEQAGPEIAGAKAEASAEAKEEGRAEAEEEAKEETKAKRRREMRPKPAKPQAGKRQRSLFEFDK
jgi:replication factor C large subunit